jgi:hypothetical protein
MNSRLYISWYGYRLIGVCVLRGEGRTHSLDGVDTVETHWRGAGGGGQ